ncbi:uncharacterized protein EI90DRAFT_2949726 [Cantharellus anzutake]|uniref:uncharacterized protein n=1 Tax=Cantharellus anzutake TaxID=1750568 RepID=UPI001907A40F|nr:uncharacterized protein EI90DRAFT_2949726 [Cantharellus anzutake]KAF8313514.1 hypothetical protein EI90DRAFT_2949726 [Cantharellus anzutake]
MHSPTFNGLTLHENRRYGRQMIMDNFGLPSQLKLKSASVLVVGSGGLGCPALQYLSAAGIGHIGIVDHDEVELSNLQRQILHSDNKIGWNKAHSAGDAVRSINPNIEVSVYPISITPSNLESILYSHDGAAARSSGSLYDVVLDCTDNSPTRYLLADATSKFRIPLVSGAALRYDGQLAVFNFGKQGPCYRCVFPKPPKPETLGTCEEEGVLGSVTGVIGTLQALEAIKILAGLIDEDTYVPTLTLFSALSPVSPFRTIKLRGRRPSCAACGVESSVDFDAVDYVALCDGVKLLGEFVDVNSDRIQPEILRKCMNGPNDFVIIDTRPPTEFGICSIPGSKNVPLKELLENPAHTLNLNLSTPRGSSAQEGACSAKRHIICVCRRGNDSQKAARAIKSVAEEYAMDVQVTDLVGGLVKWAQDTDPLFPIY